MPKSIFVFGSNLFGIHGAGAARFALDNHGAILGQGTGFQGDSYAIPTKDEHIRSLPLQEIRKHVLAFLCAAECLPNDTFHVTQIGCGLAGFTPEQIAPMFRDAPNNCQFSKAWEPWLPGYTYWTEE